jgi:hypothetical protein
MTQTQLTFDLPDCTEQIKLPESVAPTGFEKFRTAHPWFVDWIRDYLRLQVRNGARSVSVRAAMEAARPKLRAYIEMSGVGYVGFDNRWHVALTEAVYHAAPDLRPFIRRRER